MTIGKIVRALAAALKKQYEGTGCEVAICARPEDTGAALAALPHKWRIVLQMAGFNPLPGPANRVREAKIAVVVQQAPALTQIPGESVALDRAGDKPIVDLIDDVEAFLTGLIFSESADAAKQHPEIDGQNLRFVSGNWLAVEGIEGAFALEWGVRYSRASAAPVAATGVIIAD